MKSRLGFKLISLFVVGAMTMSGCAAKTTTTTNTTNTTNTNSKETEKLNTLTVWAWDTNFNIPIIKLAAEYYKKAGHPDFKLNVVEMGANDSKQKMVTAFAAKTKEGLPDIVLMEDYVAPNLLRSYEGKYADLTNKIDFNNFAKYKVEAATVDGKTYSIPFDAGTAGLYYRKDYLEQAGYAAKDLENLTWSKFLKIGEDVKQKTGKWFIVLKPNKGSNYFQVAMQSAGLWYFNKDNSINIANNPAIKEMVGVLKQINDKKLSKPVDYWAAEGIGAVTGGEAAAVISAVWYAPTIMSAKDQAGKWAVTRIPTLETVPKATNSSNIGGSSWYVMEDSSNKELAIDFLKAEFAGDNEFYQDILVNRAAVGTYLPSQSGKAYTTPVEFFSGQKIYEDFSKWSKDIPSVNYGVYTDEAADAVSSVLQDYYDGKLTLEAALKQAEETYRLQVGE